MRKHSTSCCFVSLLSLSTSLGPFGKFRTLQSYFAERTSSAVLYSTKQRTEKKTCKYVDDDKAPFSCSAKTTDLKKSFPSFSPVLCEALVLRNKEDGALLSSKSGSLRPRQMFSPFVQCCCVVAPLRPKAEHSAAQRVKGKALFTDIKYNNQEEGKKG